MQPSNRIPSIPIFNLNQPQPREAPVSTLMPMPLDVFTQHFLSYEDCDLTIIMKIACVSTEWRTKSNEAKMWSEIIKIQGLQGKFGAHELKSQIKLQLVCAQYPIKKDTVLELNHIKFFQYFTRSTNFYVWDRVERILKAKKIVLEGDLNLPRNASNIMYLDNDYIWNELGELNPEERIFLMQKLSGGTVVELEGLNNINPTKVIDCYSKIISLGKRIDTWISNNKHHFSNIKDLKFGILNYNEISLFPNLAKFGTLGCRYQNADAIIYPLQLKEMKKLKTIDDVGFGWTEIPLNLFNNTKLTTLKLYGAKLGNISEEIAKLTSLTRLHFVKCEITSLPTEIEALKKLKILKLDYNLLTTLPIGIKSLKKLEKISLTYNKFTEFPLSLCKLENLRYLQLGWNEIKTIPDEIAGMINLDELNLKNNLIEKLNNSICKISLTKLNLQCNTVRKRDIPENFKKPEKFYISAGKKREKKEKEIKPKAQSKQVAPQPLYSSNPGHFNAGLPQQGFSVPYNFNPMQLGMLHYRPFPQFGLLNQFPLGMPQHGFGMPSSFNPMPLRMSPQGFGFPGMHFFNPMPNGIQQSGVTLLENLNPMRDANLPEESEDSEESSEMVIETTTEVQNNKRPNPYSEDEPAQKRRKK